MRKTPYRTPGGDAVDRRPQWHDDALCREIGAEPFFPAALDGGGGAAEQHLEPARAICRDCPVQQPCLEHALTWPEHGGIWAATTPAERRRMRQERGLPWTR